MKLKRKIEEKTIENEKIQNENEEQQTRKRKVEHHHCIIFVVHPRNNVSINAGLE